MSKVKPDGVVVVVELISKGRSSIQPVTAWKNTVDALNLIWRQKKKATNTSLVAKTATHRGYKIAFNDSISNSDENVNTKSNLGQSVDETQDLFSLSDEAEDIGPVGDFSTPLNSMYYGEDADTVDHIGHMSGAETFIPDVEEIEPVADNTK